MTDIDQHNQERHKDNPTVQCDGCEKLYLFGDFPFHLQKHGFFQGFSNGSISQRDIGDEEDTQLDQLLVGSVNFDFNTTWKKSDFLQVQRIQKNTNVDVWLVKIKNTEQLVVYKQMAYYTEKEKLMAHQEKNNLIKIYRKIMQTSSSSSSSSSFIHVIKPLGFFVDTEEFKAYFVLEYCSGGSLNKYIGTMKNSHTTIKVDAAWNMIAQVTLAVNQMHLNGVIIGYINTESILLTSDLQVKLSNFMLNGSLQDGRQIAPANDHSIQYYSPEAIQVLNSQEIEKEKERIDNMRGQQKKQIFTIESDIWAVGIVLFKLLAQKHPFIDATDRKKGITVSEFMYNIVTEQPPELPNNYPENMKNLIKRMLEKDPIRRITAEAILSVPEVAANILRN
ncbi:MAG: hypothetical protein EZS28_024812 [Streblomastix strix]|uniref:Protein kinase domain-containing protein n=1 Tax=Streblomastix strix TaxID=222440 RepID=A0A5J4VB32_9EUKA|nr:MAG: hypothetical protein EZS28_024812 [Streblomastix strix]